MNERSIEIYSYLRAMVGVHSAMGADERAELERWEKENLDGCSVSTSDWPGWEKYIGRRPVFEVKTIDRSGYIYLIRSGETSRYKIGLSKNVSERIDSLQVGNPDRLSLVFSFSVVDAFTKEQELHKHFEGKRITREWFELTEEDVKSLLSMVGA